MTHNNPIAFTVTALFIPSAGYAILAAGALPIWTGWVVYGSAILYQM